MATSAQLRKQILQGSWDAALAALYGADPAVLQRQRGRYAAALEQFELYFGPGRQVQVYSAPGRAELGGNHTDHQGGYGLAAAVTLDLVAVAARNTDGYVRVKSRGFNKLDVIDLATAEPQAGESTHSASLIRGIAEGFRAAGKAVGGFDAYTASDVLRGSGLSSSAAFEMGMAAIWNGEYGCGLAPAELAKICQYAENTYFGKPSGLLDQMASSTGGLAYIDFQNDDPQVKPMNYDFSKKGYSLVVVNTGGSHDDLTADYASIPAEMKAVARVFGQEVLRQVQPERFFLSLPVVREKLDVPNVDRALLRATHFFDENRRVSDQVTALQEDNLEDFLRLVIESGRSSYCYLQNLFASPQHQELCLALMLAERRLAGKGAWRVHGGGFAGTTLNFVPTKELNSFVKEMESVFGQHCCNVLDIRPEGPACIKLGK